MRRQAPQILASALLFASSIQITHAANIEGMIAKVDAQIEASIADYNHFLTATGDEKLELITRINELEGETIAQRETERKLANEAKTAELELHSIGKRIESLNALVDYTKGVLSDYLNSFESRINLSEDQQYVDQLNATRSKLGNDTMSVPETINAYMDVVELGITRQERLIGGYIFEGKAITRSGGVKQGEIALLGPVAYFKGKDKATAGMLRFNSGTIEPGLNEFNADKTALIQQFFASGSGLLPLDASLGKAISLQKAKGTPIDHVKKGGWVGYVILLLGALAIVVSFIKLSDLKGSRTAAPVDLNALAELAIKDPTAALTEAESYPPATRDILRVVIENLHMKEDFLMDSLMTTILRYRPSFERYLPFLATTAAAAPLLGLLGTVVGMIKTFTLITVFGTGDAKSLSSGISEALVTTELGLIVAIPALILHGAFIRMSRSRAAALERTGTDFLSAALSKKAKQVA